MGAHSTVYIALPVARKLYQEHVGSDVEVTRKQLEDFYDRVLDERLHNCILVQEDDERLKPGKYFDDSMSEWALKGHLLEYLADNPGERHNSVTGENAMLRSLLARTYSGLPTGVDFNKDSAAEIERKLTNYHTGVAARSGGYYQPQRVVSDANGFSSQQTQEAEQASLRG